ncbi:hypothetical protein C1645_811528 [Glomus cerebriforme]|uniref:F-box domain-containing protein n=1 Tax=Glomus cerebriforme TaxID=658196 RepID=A0A397TS59_9GLOM|nr:hypothetical protein C1645_811528 [Glomus cerebriforme]
MAKLPADCLNEIFEYLEHDKFSLYSCLLVNRLWCQVSVRILWRDIWSFKPSASSAPIKYRSNMLSQILSVLISCLPKESKDLLYKNEIFISMPTSKSPFFNYVTFFQVFSFCEINQMIDIVIKYKPITSMSLDYNKYLITQEIIKMFMSQIFSLKKLIYYNSNYNKNHNNSFNISFIYFPGAKDRLINLSELNCDSNIHSEFFYQLSQLCHNLQSITIRFENFISVGLSDLIISQNNLKNLKLIQLYNNIINWSDIIPSLKKINTLTNLIFCGKDNSVPMSFISSYSNLQLLNLTFFNESAFKDFKNLQNIIFSNLKVLKIPFEGPKPEILLQFLKNNGNNINELNIDGINHLVKSSISKFCPNLKKLFIIFNKNELNLLKNIFKNCKFLESINVWCSNQHLNEKDLLNVVAKYSPKNFYKLKIFNFTQSTLLSKDLESFFLLWNNRLPKKSLVLIIIKDGYEKNSLDMNLENMKIIKKFINLGVIKKFEIEKYDPEE